MEGIGIKVDWVTELQDGLQKWQAARIAGDPYEMVLTDMQFPLSSGKPICSTAGLRVIARLHAEMYSVPVIVISSVQYQVPALTPLRFSHTGLSPSAARLSSRFC